MEHKITKIWPDDLNVDLVKIESGARAESPVILVLPGGGYMVCADREAEPVGEAFAGLGYRCYVLRYSTHTCGTNPHVYFPEPLRQVAAAVLRIREEVGADVPIIPMGFSAGGHLAACYCTQWDREEVWRGLTEETEKIRPALCVLGYGAVDYACSEQTLKKILGEKEEYEDEDFHRYAPIEQVRKGITPPTFLFHSVTDPMIPVAQSVNYASSLEGMGIPYELYLCGCGGHAYGVGAGLAAGAWVGLADRFIKGILGSPENYDKAYVWQHAGLRAKR